MNVTLASCLPMTRLDIDTLLSHSLITNDLLNISATLTCGEFGCCKYRDKLSFFSPLHSCLLATSGPDWIALWLSDNSTWNISTGYGLPTAQKLKCHKIISETHSRDVPALLLTTYLMFLPKDLKTALSYDFLSICIWNDHCIGTWNLRWHESMFLGYGHSYLALK